MQGSDSSMDDCNMVFENQLFGHCLVQIPLWTIVTKVPPDLRQAQHPGSDSSMDDCNATRLISSKREEVGSDSSMDDCNPGSTSESSGLSCVQIPLWTIVTNLRFARRQHHVPVQIPLWTIVTKRWM